MYLEGMAESGGDGAFSASFSSLPAGCGGNLNSGSGFIYSPNYPNPYDPNDDCGWLIDVGQGHVVNFEFLDLDLEHHHNCTWDHVALYDGPDSEAPLITMQCGDSLPSPAKFSSTSNQMFVRFKADGSYSLKGFKASYETVKSPQGSAARF